MSFDVNINDNNARKSFVWGREEKTSAYETAFSAFMDIDNESLGLRYTDLDIKRVSDAASLSDAKVKIGANPTSDFTTLESDGIYNVIIRDQRNIILAEQENVAKGDRIDLSSYASGAYIVNFINAETDQVIDTKKVIKTK